ncbi:hypothetical protein NKF26_20880 [Haladaptatus sp. AB618]|uniref:hypothetical protein n=1 Tax=Haladaptatus sp. AB618 TaxID=2934173 RepID=UPI00209C1E47|nr:hypothetical protein [Haladaptatus sp. AB618]MCO8256270.1 hypothetical protein [Haladaptatus sp. AB618]
MIDVVLTIYDGGLFEIWSLMASPIGKKLIQLLNVQSEFSSDEVNGDAIDYAEEDFLEVFAVRSFEYVFGWIGVVLLTIFVVDLFSCGTLPNQTYGLGLDVIGAVILGRGLLKGTYSIAAETATKVGFSREKIDSLVENTVDGILGITILVLGVALQFLATVNAFPNLIHSSSTFC